MHLTDLCLDLIEISPGTNPILVTGLAVNSTQVKAGNLFFAIDGSHRNGRDYIEQAIAAGAVAVITGNTPLTKPVGAAIKNNSVPVMHCDNPRQVMARMAARGRIERAAYGT